MKPCWPALADKARDGKARRQLGDQRTVRGRLNKEGRDITASPFSAEQIGSIVDLIGEGTISEKIAKDCSRSSGRKAATRARLVETRGMKQVTGPRCDRKGVDDIIAGQSGQGPLSESQAAACRLVLGQVN